MKEMMDLNERVFYEKLQEIESNLAILQLPKSKEARDDPKTKERDYERLWKARKDLHFLLSLVRPDTFKTLMAILAELVSAQTPIPFPRQAVRAHPVKSPTDENIKEAS